MNVRNSQNSEEKMENFMSKFLIAVSWQIIYFHLCQLNPVDSRIAL